MFMSWFVQVFNLTLLELSNTISLERCTLIGEGDFTFKSTDASTKSSIFKEINRTEILRILFCKLCKYSILETTCWSPEYVPNYVGISFLSFLFMLCFVNSLLKFQAFEWFLMCQENLCLHCIRFQLLVFHASEFCLICLNLFIKEFHKKNIRKRMPARCGRKMRGKINLVPIQALLQSALCLLFLIIISSIGSLIFINIHIHISNQTLSKHCGMLIEWECSKFPRKHF